LLGAPFSDTVSIYAKTGIYRYQLDFTCTGTGVPCTNPNRRVNGKPVFLGLGLEWNPLKGLFVRTEYEVYLKVGEKFNATGTTGTSKSDVKLATLGVGYRF
jgi:opacity protein-like surface antigen